MLLVLKKVAFLYAIYKRSCLYNVLCMWALFLFWFFLVMFLLLCLHKHACILWKRIQGPYYQGTSTKHTYHAVNSTDKNSKAAVTGHAFRLKKTLPC